MKKILLILFTAFAFIGCSDDDAREADKTSLKLQFNNQVEGNAINMEAMPNYEKNGGEMFSVNQLKYIISNISLMDLDGENFVYPQAESYFVINEEITESKEVVLEDVPQKSYTSITFGLGVDQSNYPLNGVNDFVPTAEENEMLWSWSAGYIFLKMEGNYNSTQTPMSPFKYHIGSHGEQQDNYREVTLTFNEPLNLNEVEELVITSDIKKIFNAAHPMLLDDKSDIQVDPENAPKIIANFAESFSTEQ